MSRARPSSVVLALFALWGSAAAATPTALPPVVEAAFVCKDLRRVVDAQARARASVERTRLGRVYHAGADAAELDPWRELAALVALAGPSDAPVPARLLVVRDQGQLTWQAHVALGPGFLERLASARAHGEGPRFEIERDEGRLAVRLGERDLFGTLDADGLLLAPDPAGLTSVVEPRALDGELGELLADSDAVAYLVGDGQLAAQLREPLADPRSEMLLRGIDTVAVGWRHDGDRSSRFRVAIDAPMLMQLASLVRRPVDRGAARLTDDVASSVVIDLPPHVLAASVPALIAQLAAAGTTIPDELEQSLSRLSGRLELATFLTPGDWALSLGFGSPADAAAALSALEPFVRELLAEAGFVADDVIAREPTSAGMHVRPHDALDGLRVVAVGDQVLVVAQRDRAARLMANGPTAEDLLTPLVRETTARPGFLRAYTLGSADGAWVTYGAWLARFVDSALERRGVTAPLVHDLTLAAAKLGLTGMLTYDYALSLELSGRVLLLELSSSEI